jgi:hypothetical protein
MNFRCGTGERRDQGGYEIAFLQEIEIEADRRRVLRYDHANLLREGAARQFRHHLLIDIRLDNGSESLQGDRQAVFPAFTIREPEDGSLSDVS